MWKLLRETSVVGILSFARAALAQEAAPTPPQTRLYGWVQQGFAVNFDRPRDRINFGANFGWRSNDYRLNQVYLVSENSLEHEGDANLGFRVDFLVGHDAPFFAANGLFSDFTGFDRSSGVGAAGPASYRRVDRVGVDLPLLYLEVALPGILTEKGFDIRLGKFYTLMGREVYPAADTDFYSRTYENVYGTPFTHTGLLATLHAGSAVDLIAGVVRGWDVFEDNNGRPSFHGAVIWNSADAHYNWFTAWITGPEQLHENHNDRTLVSSYLTARFGRDNEWILATGGHYGVEDDATVNPLTGRLENAEWYAYAIHLFYAVNPALRLNVRVESFRDDDATRTAQLKRPGFAASFYDFTAGIRFMIVPSVQIRPEVRLDWTPDARPYDDQTDESQIVPAVDVIWKF